MVISIGCDHAGVGLKALIAEELKGLGHEVVDRGTHTTDSIDYPDYAAAVAADVAGDSATLGVLICGTGQGMAMAANKVKGIRAAVCADTFSAAATRGHNNANILCIGERVVGAGLALELVRTFVSTEFEGGRHQRRVNKIIALEG